MSFDEYANHIYQKHRIAIALAIIKTKPSDVPTAHYLEQIKSKVDDKMDDDITVCSDDFLIDDDDEMNDSVTILKDFDIENVRHEESSFKELVDEINDDQNMVIENAKIDIHKKISQITCFQTHLTSNISQKTHNSDGDITFYEENHNRNPNFDNELSQSTINEESNSKIKDTDHNTWSNSKFTENNTLHKPSNTDIRNSNHNPLELSNNDHNTWTNTKFTENNTLNKPANTEIKNSNQNHEEISNIATDLTYFDSQKTVLYTLHGFTQNYTHYSPSQSDIIIPKKYIYGIDRHKCDNNKKEVVNKNTNTIADVNSELYLQNVNTFSNETEHVSERHNIQNILEDEICDNIQLNKEFEYSQTLNVFAQNNDENYYNKTQDDIINNMNQPTSVNDSNKANNDATKIKEISNINPSLTQYSRNIDEYFGEMQNIEKNPYSSEAKSIDHGYDPHYLAMEITNNTICTDSLDAFSYKIIKGDTNNFKNDSDLTANNKNQMINAANVNENVDQTQNTVKQTLDPSENTLNQLPTATDKSQNIDEIEELNMADEENASEEVISYKVLEEFNKVKTFLSRQNRRLSCDGYSTDSGYRSDSQIRSSNRSALQLSGTWLNQSGCCLFNYIMRCPLVSSTRDITEEIARVLSQLIDRLHEEEKYPSFLEELLDTLDVLLLQVYEGESNEFLKKDECIQRILLLNKSFQIQRHTIEKISNILNSFHTKVTETESTFELENIDEIENISYIFHILEILLKKYLKGKNLSQASLQSQDEKFFKKSSITDIWRKKWNPNIEAYEGSREKKCVLKICGEILNKIVVDCVNSYSLVAYAALKCFNSMQT